MNNAATRRYLGLAEAQHPSVTLRFGNSSWQESTQFQMFRHKNCSISKPKGSKKHSQMHLIKSESPKRKDKRNLETLHKEVGTLFCLEAELSQFKRRKDFKSGAKSIWLLFVPFSSSVFQRLRVNHVETMHQQPSPH